MATRAAPPTGARQLLPMSAYHRAYLIGIRLMQLNDNADSITQRHHHLDRGERSMMQIARSDVECGHVPVMLQCFDPSGKAVNLKVHPDFMYEVMPRTS